MNILQNASLILLGILSLASLIVIHEFGHLIVGLILKAKPKKFAVGFGKTLWSRNYKGVELCFNAIPLGGYVEFGTTQFPQMEKDKEVIAYWKWIFIALAGPLANFVTTWVILLGIIMSIHLNLTVYENTQITNKSIIRVEKPEEFEKANFKQYAILYKNKVYTEKDKGVEINEKDLKNTSLSIFTIIKSSTIKASETFVFMAVQYTNGLGQLFKKSEYKQLSGPIGIIHQFKENSKSLTEALGFICFLSFAIGFFNLIPLFTILDGGRIVIAIIQTIVGDRKIVNTITDKLNQFSLMFFLIMFAYTTIGDLFKLF